MGHLPLSETEAITRGQRARRFIWGIASALLYRPSPRVFHSWRRMLLRAFGATIDEGAHPYPGAQIWAPWNLHMKAHSCLSDNVDCYSVAKITIGVHATVSQHSYLCSASHDYTKITMPVIAAPITIDDEAWVAAAVFIGPGVTVGRGAVVGARSTVISDIPPWQVVAGSPPRSVRLRPEFRRE